MCEVLKAQISAAWVPLFMSQSAMDGSTFTSSIYVNLLSKLDTGWKPAVVECQYHLYLRGIMSSVNLWGHANQGKTI